MEVRDNNTTPPASLAWWGPYPSSHRNALYCILTTHHPSLILAAPSPFTVERIRPKS